MLAWYSKVKLGRRGVFFLSGGGGDGGDGGGDGAGGLGLGVAGWRHQNIWISWDVQKLPT